MSKWSEEFNKLPIEIRHIGAMNEAEMRMNQLEMEKTRVKKRYRESIREINQHIENLRQWIISEGK